MARRLDDLTIRGFRAIGNLRIPRITDINLIVGKNSTGKTTILEAIRLLLSEDLRPRLYSLLSEREEYNLGRRDLYTSIRTGAATELAYEALFSGRPTLSEECVFEIGSGYGDPVLTVSFVWLRVERREDASIRYFPASSLDLEADPVPGLRISRGNGVQALIPFDRLNRLVSRRLLRDEADTNVVYLPSIGMSIDEIGRMWDSVALTDDEDDIVDALRIISPTLEKLVMVQSPEARTDRMLMAKVRQFPGPVPFRSLGEGANHLLSLALALVRARGGTLLIDEIANGVHYSVQASLWEMISRQASRHDVQVFATTHSLDCVRGLRRAAIGLAGSVPSLFRLESSQKGMKVVAFSADELSVISDEEIEVR